MERARGEGRGRERMRGEREGKEGGEERGGERSHHYWVLKSVFILEVNFSSLPSNSILLDFGNADQIQD